MTQRDQIYATPLLPLPPGSSPACGRGKESLVPPFCFDARVAAVFPDMIRRSVPGYDLIVQALPWLAARVVQPHSHVYDLGCSLGASIHAVRHGLAHTPGCRLLAVDNSAAMIERAREWLAGFRAETPIELQCVDVLDVPIENASLVMLNFTLQFIPQDQRLALLQRIRAGMRPGGVLLLSEKIAIEDEALAQLITELHHDFKRAQGYSELEIAQKRQALENVLIPETLAAHRERLLAAGFAAAEPCLQHTRFVSLLARV
ncbi:MAG: carboxy-S-adenosyl-L-methionine synthase CmoA [Halothiobacillaceae bacterium]|nr:carboxy-S-adenosyl-L-methionine synthase CmoA [Halothiobacillaceae bacterium]